MKDKTLIAMAGAIYATFAIHNNNTRTYIIQIILIDVLTYSLILNMT